MNCPLSGDDESSFLSEQVVWRQPAHPGGDGFCLDRQAWLSFRNDDTLRSMLLSQDLTILPAVAVSVVAIVTVRFEIPILIDVRLLLADSKSWTFRAWERLPRSTFSRRCHHCSA